MSATSPVLALGLGTATCWAMHAPDGATMSSTMAFKPRRFDGGASRATLEASCPMAFVEYQPAHGRATTAQQPGPAVCAVACKILEHIDRGQE